MINRIISALVMAPIALAAIWYGSPYFTILVAVGGCLAAHEWYRMISDDPDGHWFVPKFLAGLIYIAIPCVVLLWLRDLDRVGLQLIIWFFAVIWATDIGAYFSGKTLGGPKLAPNISPNKTWAGFFGGLIFAVIVSLILHQFSEPMIAIPSLVAACIVISIVGQLGDLLESWVKRKLSIKDSGSLIPGHGGILDRIDAILLSAPVAGVIAFFFQFGDVPWK